MSAKDVPNYDGLDWRGGTCYGNFQCAGTEWIRNSCDATSITHGSPMTIEFDVTYQNNTPTHLSLLLDAWEEDGCGSDCTHDNCLLNSDDGHVYEQIGNVYYENLGPPCTWNGGDETNTATNFFSSNQKWGVSVQAYYKYLSDVNGVHIWNGKVNDNWFTPCNWNTSHVPDSNDDVQIPSSAVNMPRIPSAGNIDAYCNTIQIESGAKITIENGAKLNVTQ